MSAAMTSSWTQLNRGLDEAAEWFADTVSRVGDRWEAPALGVWSVRGLVGHTAQGLMLWRTALRQPAATLAIGSVPAYFRAAKAMAPGVIAQAGRRVGDAFGADPGAQVVRLVRELPGAGRARRGEDVVGTPLGGMRLRDYLATRVFELTVHTADLVTALDLTQEVPSDAAVVALQVMAELAVDAGLTMPLLLAATGRGPLPDRFCVL